MNFISSGTAVLLFLFSALIASADDPVIRGFKESESVQNEIRTLTDKGYYALGEPEARKWVIWTGPMSTGKWSYLVHQNFRSKGPSYPAIRSVAAFVQYTGGPSRFSVKEVLRFEP